MPGVMRKELETSLRHGVFLTTDYPGIGSPEAAANIALALLPKAGIDVGAVISFHMGNRHQRVLPICLVEAQRLYARHMWYLTPHPGMGSQLIDSSSRGKIRTAGG